MIKQEVVETLKRRGYTVISIRREDRISPDNEIDWVVETPSGLLYLDANLTQI